MPLHFPHVGHQNHRRHDAETKDNDSYIPTSPESSRSNLSPQRHATVSSTTSSESAPPSILKKSSTSASDSTSASGYLSKRKSGLTTFDGTDTISSTHDSDDEREGSSSVSTPATSVSSLNNQCPLPASSAGQKFPFFVMTLSSTSTLSFIALPVTMRPVVLNAIRHAWRKGVSKMDQVEYLKELMEKHKENGCDGGVWEVTMKDNCWMPNSQDKVSYVEWVSTQLVLTRVQVEANPYQSHDSFRKRRLQHDFLFPYIRKRSGFLHAV